jgi:adenosine deaminase
MTRDYLANQGVRVELLDDVAFADQHVRGVLQAVLEGRDAAAAQTGRPARLRLGLSRTFESEGKYRAMASVVREYAPHLVGMDVQGKALRGFAEPLPEGLVRLIESLRPALPDLTLHAGELEGADSIEQALGLRPNGLGHGVRAVESEALMRRLVELGITLEVCPTSNALLIGPTLAQLAALHGGAHPLSVLLQHGVRCAVATDDPANFGTDLAREEQVARGLGVDLALLAANAQRRWDEVGANARLADAA